MRLQWQCSVSVCVDVAGARTRLIDVAYRVLFVWFFCRRQQCTMYTVGTFVLPVTSANVDKLLLICHRCIQKQTAEEAGIKATISPEICCRTTLRNLVIPVCILY